MTLTTTAPAADPFPDLPADANPLDHARPGRHGLSPEDRARQKASDGNRHLMFLSALLALAADAARGYLDRHPDGCRCDNCRLSPHAEQLREDTAGIAWAASTGAASLRGLIVHEIDVFSDDYSTDLRRLLAFVDEWEATPAAVVAPDIDPSR